MIHFCQDELAALGRLGSVGVACKYCWYRVAGLWRRRRDAP